MILLYLYTTAEGRGSWEVDTAKPIEIVFGTIIGRYLKKWQNLV